MKTEIEITDNLGTSTDLNAEWNDLCRNSQNATGASQAEVLASFLANFAPNKRLLAVCVRDGTGRMIAGLPMIASRGSSLFSNVSSVSNEWCQCGQILIAKDSDLSSAVKGLLEGLSRLPVNSMWFDWIPVDCDEWTQLIATAQRSGWGLQVKSKFNVAVTRLPESWSAFEQTLSKNSRKRTRSELKKILEAGEIRLQVASCEGAESVSDAMQTALEIELHSWKGPQGTAIACHPGAKAFFLEAAQLLSDSKNFRIFLLRLNEEAIAFDFGEVSGGCYRSYKVSYLDRYADLAPGHVLNQLVFKHFIEDPKVHTCDSVGPMTHANSRFSNDQYRLGKLVLAPGSWLSNAPGRSLVSTLKMRDALKSRQTLRSNCPDSKLVPIN